MRPTGALPLQQGWRGLQSAWETANTTLPTYVVPFTLGTEFPRVHFSGFGSTHPLGAEGAPRDVNPNPKVNDRKANSGTKEESTRLA